jgi:hypothetical protein
MTFPFFESFMRLTAHFFVFILGIFFFSFLFPYRSGSLFSPEPDGI